MLDCAFPSLHVLLLSFLKRPIDFTEKFFRNNTVKISQENKEEKQGARSLQPTINPTMQYLSHKPLWSRHIIDLFQLLTWTRLRNSVGTTGKSALESVKRPRLKVICWKLTKIKLLKVTNIPPTIQTVANCRNFVELYLPSLNPLSPNSAQNQFSPNDIHTLSTDKLWELIKWSPK